MGFKLTPCCLSDAHTGRKLDGAGRPHSRGAGTVHPGEHTPDLVSGGHSDGATAARRPPWARPAALIHEGIKPQLA